MVLFAALGAGSAAADATESPAVGDGNRDSAAARGSDFESRVRPLLAKHCTECHGRETGADHGGLDLETVDGLLRGGSRGPAIDRQRPAASLLLRTLTYDDEQLQMPPTGKLSDAEIETVRGWLLAGAVVPEYRAEPAPRAATSGIDWELGRRHWAFQPLRDVPVPPTAANAADSAIDAFVAAALAEQGLEPNRRASPATLLRRLSFDVVGLPPAVEELDAFERDPSPVAYAAAVDRLLASPHYGERWARMWLDLARYADATPWWENSAENGWIYRDWVVRALNANLGYDRFLELQLAADLLPAADPADLAALGFLGLSPTYWKELQLAPAAIAQIVADEWDERIDAVTRTFLGLGVACARCHDHKFDPVSLEDYYALAGVFASTQLHAQPLLPPDAAAPVLRAHEELRPLRERLRAVDDPSSSEAEQLRQEIAAFRAARPEVEHPLAHTVREASVYVEADGPDASRLAYREGEPRDLPVFRRGNPANPGPVAPRRYLAVFQHAESAEQFVGGSGRDQLARAMLRDSQGLVARVIVNRIWAQHFGAGLVRTPSDFGAQGDRPTHPELLEHLAYRFVRQGWDVKWLHRQILLSATWQQSAEFREQAYAADPDNRLLWRMSRRRFDFEQWRDALLAASGELQTAGGGPPLSLDDPAHLRRTLYASIARDALHPVLRLHDFPEATAHSPSRTPTITPLQQLFVLNSPWARRRAEVLRDRVRAAAASPEERVALAYRLLCSRRPDELEIAAARDYIEGVDAPADQAAVDDRWTNLMQALLGLNEVCFLD
jgi:cytochrome c553